ncbi:MAG: hypothetical protein KatS3mg115_0156 [Candidatus Poribacteria bacterium]|nr:MAG: hypothetical protein KatS3mg115_0156 [Candidatus Poribacteria bacterium]
MADLGYPPGMYPGRFRARRELLSFLNQHFAERTTPEVLDREAIYEKADRMIHSPLTKAFDLSEEPIALRQGVRHESIWTGMLDGPPSC